MTQQMLDQSGTAENPYSPPPGYMNPSSIIHHPSGDYIHEQFGGGGQIPMPLPELTPTRLRTNIKATTRDVGVARQANIRCQVHSTPSSQPTQSTDLLPSLVDGHDGATSCDASSLTLPPTNSRHPSPTLPYPVDGQDGAASSDSSSLTLPMGSSNSLSLPLPLPLPNSHHTSPFSAGAASSCTTHHPSLFVGDPASQHPVQLDDLFYASIESQPGWSCQDASNAFDFTMLLSDQVSGMTAAGGHLIDDMSHVPPPLNLIPPTPLKADDDAAPCSTQGGHTFTRASGQQLDLSYYPANGIQERFPEENSNHIDHESGGLEQSLMG